MTQRNIQCADLFCGAGGTSTGLAMAAHRLGLHLDLVAVNHWQTAVDSHTANHPWARHVCADLASVEADPSKLITGGKLDLLVASPECTHHSNARGGKPCSDQSRASAWHVLHWCERLQVRDVLIENVREFEHWGPLNADGRPNKQHRGETFDAFCQALRSMGYRVEHKILCAADYGGATTRRRLFVRASRGAIAWPVASHVGHWRGAREIIDWNLKGEDITTRKRPLAPRTLARIEAGLRKFGGEAFLVVLAHAGADNSRVRDLDEPMPAIPAGHRGEHGLCEPFLLGQQSGSSPRSVNDPSPTIAGAGAISLVEPFLITLRGSQSRPRSADEPLPTVSTGGGRGGVHAGLVEPFVVEYHSEKRPGEARVRSIEEPLATLTVENRFGLCEPFLTKYYGSGAGATPVSDPLATVTAKDRFALVEPYTRGIRFRMLQPHELAAAMGFHGYKFVGTKTDQVKQIGNAVQVDQAEALCASILGRYVA